MNDASAEIARADIMTGAGRFADAIAILAQVVAADPDNGRAFAMLAQAQIGAGNSAVALAAADRAGQLDPGSAWPHRLRSIALRQAGEAGAAIDAAREACRLDPHQWMNHFNLAQAALDAPGYSHGWRTGQQIAREASVTARELAPNEPSVHYVAGQVSRAAGRHAEAVEHFQRTLALDPAHSSALNELGRIKLDGGKSGAAAKHFIQAARLAPGQGVYGHNVEVAVSRAERSVRVLARWVIYGSWLVVIVAFGVPHQTLADRVAILAVIPVAALGIAVFWQIQLRRMPKQARPLFQGRSMLLALGVALSSLVVGIAVVDFAPAQFGNSAGLVIIFLFAARYSAFKILRDGARRRHEQIKNRSAATRI